MSEVGKLIKLRLTPLGVNLTETIIAHLVHETVEQNWRTFLVNAEFTRWIVIVPLRY